jgi:outer membrane lipoprotein LolB
MLQRLFAIAVTFLVCACVSIPNQAGPEKQFKSHAGRFSINYQKDGIAQREQGGFEWKIQIDSPEEKAMQLSLLSPLGNTVVVIALNPSEPQINQRASFTSPNQTAFAPDLDSLMQNTLGWRLPLTALLPWLEKSPPKQMPADWEIAVQSRHATDLPKLITANNERLNLSVRLVFEE